MYRRSYLRASASLGVAVLGAGCSEGSDDGDRTPTDLLGAGNLAVGGMSIDAPEDEQGAPEYYRAVAGIKNTSGATVDYARATISFFDEDEEVLETGASDIVGIPAELWWAFGREYGGELPGSVSNAEVTTIEGFVDAGLDDSREAGDVELANVTAERGADDMTVAVTGDVTNTRSDPLDDLRVFANLWLAEDRVVATASTAVEGLAGGETRRFEAAHRFSPNGAHLVPIVVDENEVTVPYVGGPPPFTLVSE